MFASWLWVRKPHSFWGAWQPGFPPTKPFQKLLVDVRPLSLQCMAFCVHIVHNCVRVTHVLWRSVYLRVGTVSYLSLYPLWPSAVSCPQYTPISCLWDKRVSKGMRDSVCPALEVGTGQNVGWMTYPSELSAQCSAWTDSGTDTCGWKGACLCKEANNNGLSFIKVRSGPGTVYGLSHLFFISTK